MGSPPDTLLLTMPVALETATLAGKVDDLSRQGFSEQFKVVGDRLRAVAGAKEFQADQVVVAEYHRFEGVSDPDDMSVLYAIETRSGLRGTLVDAFGVYADPLVGRFMKDVALRRN